MHDLSKFRLGSSPDEILAIETRQETINAALELTKQSPSKLHYYCKNAISIHSEMSLQDLMHKIYIKLLIQL